MPTETIAYLRVSTGKQADKGVSLDAQRTRVLAYAERYDLEPLDLIVDAGKSANSLNRAACSARWGCSVGEQIDTRSAAGRLVLNVLASVSQWEREAMAEARMMG